MVSEKDLLWLWLTGLEGRGISRGTMERLLTFFGDIRAVYEADEGALRQAGLDESAAAVLRTGRDSEKLRRCAEKWEKNGITVISRDHPLFPRRSSALQQAKPPVFLLYAKGDPELLTAQSVAIVGSRNSSEYGASAARYLSRNLARSGYCVISGMAAGIDACAQREALDVGGRTIAVLGCGVDICYPQGNRQLYERICSDGLLLSEYPPGTSPKPYYFPQRNRIIAALSKAVIVAQAAQKSGSLITADCALELGIPLFMVPGAMFDRDYEGANRLISEGASILTDWTDVVLAVGGSEALRQLREEEIRYEDPLLQQVWMALSRLPVSFEDLLLRTQLDTQSLMRALTRLELDGVVRKSADGSVMRR